VGLNAALWESVSIYLFLFGTTNYVTPGLLSLRPFVQVTRHPATSPISRLLNTLDAPTGLGELMIFHRYAMQEKTFAHEGKLWDSEVFPIWAAGVGKCHGLT
jgi:hypothetical protein